MSNKATFQETTFTVGDTVKVQQMIREGDKERVQVFEGIVIKIKGAGENKSFTVRKIATGGIGVERIWPLISPWLKKITVVREGKVRRAKLYYLRQRTGKKAIKVKERLEVITPEPTDTKVKKPRKERKDEKTAKKKVRRPRRAPRQKAVGK